MGMLKPYILLGLLACSSLSVTSCSMGAGEVNFDRYSLTLNIDPKTYLYHQAEVDLSLAPALDQGGVVLQMSDVTLRPAKNYRYSADLDKELRLLLVDELLKADLGTSIQSLKTDVYVSQFQGTIDGLALVAFSVKLSDIKSGKTILLKDYAAQTNIPQDGYDALVSELKNSYLQQVRAFISDFKAYKASIQYKFLPFRAPKMRLIKK